MISFVTPLRVTDKFRRRNWKACHANTIEHVRAVGGEWIVVENGGIQGGYFGKRAGCTRLQATGSFNRSLMRNIGWRNSSPANEWVCFVDADVIVHPEAWKLAFERIANVEAYSPYASGRFMGRQKTANRLDGFRYKWHLPSRVKSEPWTISGGIFFVKRSVLEEIGGWDVRFSGWGYEDVAMDRVLGKFQTSVGTEHCGIHLWHPGGYRDRERRKTLIFLKKQYLGKSPDRLISEYKSWQENARLLSLPTEQVSDPKSDKLVLQIVAGDRYARELEVTGGRAADYAKRCGADYIVIRGDAFPGFAIGNKWRASTIARNYKQTLLLDCDVAISSIAPSIFERVPPGHFGVVDEKAVADKSGGYFTRKQLPEIIRLADELGMRRPDKIAWSLNGGVLVIPGEYAHVYSPPPASVKSIWCLDQFYLTLMLQSGAAPHVLLDRTWNNVWISPDFHQYSLTANFNHLSGCDPESKRTSILQRLIAQT